MDTSVAVAPVAAPSSEAKSESAAFTLTARAVDQVKTVIAKEKLDGHFLTVRVVPAGCSGLGYDLNLIKETKQGDLIWDQDGVQICTDAMSLTYLKGTVVDYLTSDTQSGFKFENPNAKSSCGCGSSFSA
ncbi:MAG: iron-sulfur cluster assembly accessory protein [Archangium sp.]|nr:iron-sulfur cluster assembly accessory protein [Archangium sp.]